MGGRAQLEALLLTPKVLNIPPHPLLHLKFPKMRRVFLS